SFSFAHRSFTKKKIHRIAPPPHPADPASLRIAAAAAAAPRPALPSPLQLPSPAISPYPFSTLLLHLVSMAAGGTCPRRRGRIRRRRGGSKLGSRGGGNDEFVLKLGDHSSCGEWISVRGHRIRLEGRMRVDANGDVYVPDSEDEEPGMKVEVNGVKVAGSGGANAAADAMQMAAVGVPPDTISVGANTVVRDIDVAMSAVSIPTP
ncbi:unnamed protein product, partial [Urochloa humidicola]